MMKKVAYFLLFCMTWMTSNAQTFDDVFADSTLRLDYVLAGNNHDQHAYFLQGQQDVSLGRAQKPAC